MSRKILASAASRAGKGRGSLQNRPAALGAGFNLLAKHPTDHWPASGCPAWAGPCAGSTAHRLEGFRPGLDRFNDDPLADFVAQADRTVGIDDGLLSCFSYLVGRIQI